MSRSPAHYKTKTGVELSERQREVLRLISAGKTNGEIATALGISLDGAKWHVSEILTKLSVGTREEAAEWWRSRRRSPVRLPWRAAVTASIAWKAAAGVALVCVSAVAAVVLMARDGEEPRSAPLQACDPEAVAFEAIEARDGQGFFQAAALTASAESECNLRATLSATVASPQRLPGGFVLPQVQPAAVTTTEWIVGTSRQPLLVATWRSWCASIPTTELTFHITPMPGSGEERVRPLFLVNSPPCIGDEVSPIVLQPAVVSSLKPDLGPEDKVACYSPAGDWLKQCEQVDRLQQWIRTDTFPDVAVRFAEPTVYTCPHPGTGGLGGPSRLCEGAAAGEARSGLPVAFHGSEGDVLSVAQLRELVAGLQQSGVMRVASIGCPVSGACDGRFAIGFAVDAQHAAFYLVFETRGAGVALVSAGVSGDNALEIRRGGETATNLGATMFVPAIPPY